MAGEGNNYVFVGNAKDNLAIITGIDASIVGGQSIGGGEFIGGELKSAITAIRFDYKGITRNQNVVDGILEVFAEPGHGLFVDASLAPLNYRAFYSEELNDVIYSPAGPIFHLSLQTDYITGSRHADAFLSGLGGESGGGEDSLMGGGGTDDFEILAGSASSTLVIADFDADDRVIIKAGEGGNDSLKLVDAFTGIAGQVKYSVTNGTAVIEIDADGDSSSDNVVMFAINQQSLKVNAIGLEKDLYFSYFDYVETVECSDGDDIVDGYTDSYASFDIRGYAGNDRLFGSQGNNLIDGGSGADFMIGGDGDDIYIVDHVSDVVVERQDQGLDQVTSSVSYSLAGHIEKLTLVGALNINGVGNASSNELRGNVGENFLYGDAGDDLLYGYLGKDLLDGGGGADLMEGGLGNDRYIVDTESDRVVEVAGAGFDTIDTSISYTLSDNVEALRLMGLTGAVDGRGNAGNNWLNAVWVDVAPAAGTMIRLYGEGGNDDLQGSRYGDLLDGGSGIDTMTGGGGNDRYIVDNAADVVIEQAEQGHGFDTIDTSISYTLSDNVEALRLIGLTGAVDAHGNGGNNWLNAVWVDVAPAAGTEIRLYGEGGNDDLQGSRYDDVLDGGTGADRMTGGYGDDDYTVDDAGDVVIEQAGGGYDMVTTNISYALGANVEGLHIAGELNFYTGDGQLNYNVVGRGNEFNNLLVATDAIDTYSRIETLSLFGEGGNDRLFGSRYSDHLDGGTGADTMRGGAGDDVYIVDNTSDLVYEQASEGYDDVIISSVSYRLGLNVETLRLTGVATGSTVVAQGNDSHNTIDAREVDSFATITLLGHGGSDNLFGSDNDDLLDGGTGRDYLTGGGGTDRFRLSNELDAATNVDTIMDFERGVDVIELDDAIFSTLGLGALDPNAFVANSGGVATSVDQRIIYNTDTAQLYYDADGSQGGAAVQFGELIGLPPLTSADFVVV